MFQGTATKDEIISAGEKALVLLCNGKLGQSLDALRHQRYKEKLVTNTAKIDPNSLPPTSAPAKFHSLRVYAQVVQWREQDINIEERGWTRADGSVVPIMTDLPLAPENLLRVVRCNCELDVAPGDAPAASTTDCSPACGKCKGSICTNFPASHQELNDESDEE